MAIQSASAKLYTGIRSWCVDKNISAALSTAATITAVVQRIKRTYADLEATASISLTNERYKTYGGGNNVITPGNPRVINNTNNAKINTSLVCKFPTYIRIDLEKMQLPEGTNCVIQFEEGWVIEGDFPGSTFAPSPEVPEFFYFRTPWFSGNLRLNVSSLINYNIELRKATPAALISSSSIIARGIRNPGQLAALFGGSFQVLPTARKTAVSGSSMYSSFGPNNVGGMPEIASLTRVFFLSSTMDSELSIDVSAEKYKTFGFTNVLAESTMQIIAQKTTEIALLAGSDGALITNAVKTASVNSNVEFGANLIAITNFTTNLVINNQTISNINLTKIDGYPWDYNRTKTLISIPESNGVDHFAVTSGGTDPNKDNFTSYIYNIASDSTISITGVTSGFGNGCWAVERGNINDVNTQYVQIVDTSGNSLGSYSNSLSLPRWGSAAANGVGTNFVFISWQDYTTDGISSNEQTKYKIVNRTTGSITSLSSFVSQETRQTLSVQSNRYAGFFHYSTTYANMGNGTGALSIIDKDTSATVRSYSYSAAQAPYMSFGGMSDNYYAIINQYGSTSVQNIKVYSMSTGTAIYTLTGLTNMDKFLGIDNQFMYLKTASINKVQVIDLSTLNSVGSIEAPAGNSSQIYVSILLNNYVLMRNSGSNNVHIYYDARDYL